MALGRFTVTLYLSDCEAHTPFKDEEQDENIKGISRDFLFSLRCWRVCNSSGWLRPVDQWTSADVSEERTVGNLQGVSVQQKWTLWILMIEQASESETPINYDKYNQQVYKQIYKLIVLQTAQPAICFSHILWPSSGRCSLKDILHKTLKYFKLRINKKLNNI